MPSRLEELCIRKGLKMTEQRRVIAQVLSDSEDHPDVEMVYQRASKVDPKISIATVYRTVKRYEERPQEHHDHLIDVNSGQVIEFTNEEIERLQDAVARELGYRLVGHRLELYGIKLKDKKN
jgi:Fur family ferric uptake transcriptional regulator